MSIDIKAAKKAFQSRLQKKFEERETTRKRALQLAQAAAPKIIGQYPAIKSAYLFGSVLKPGAFRPGSDIDIAIDGGSAEDYFALWHELEDALPEWFIDLRDLPPHTLFTRHVLERGMKIYG